MLCCPECTIQYINSGRVPDTCEQEFRAYEKSVHFFKPNLGLNGVTGLLGLTYFF